MVKNLRKVLFTILLANAFGVNAQTFLIIHWQLQLAQIQSH